MKNLMTIIAISLGVIACEKETIQPTAPEADCNCATITQVEEVTDTINDMHYWEYELTNDCNGIQEVVMTYYEPFNGDNITPVLGEKVCK